MTIKPGLIVTGMIQDTLSDRTPLYRLEQFFEDQDIELMLGKSVPVSVFADHNVGRVLDRIAEIGASKIFFGNIQMLKKPLKPVQLAYL